MTENDVAKEIVDACLTLSPHPAFGHPLPVGEGMIFVPSPLGPKGPKGEGAPKGRMREILTYCKILTGHN
jgi:hypothetical protein